MNVELVRLGDIGANERIPIRSLPVVLGRVQQGDEITIEGHVASPRHCEIDQSGCRLFVRDLGSRHGTFINETRVTAAYLKPGDKLTAGLSSFLVRYDTCADGDQRMPDEVKNTQD